MEIDFAELSCLPALQADGQPDRAATDRAGHDARRERHRQRRALLDVQHARRGSADRDEKLETESRFVFIGRAQWLHARDGLVDTAAWCVRLQDHHPVGRFGASFYVTTRDRFAIDGEDRESRASTPIDEI